MIILTMIIELKKDLMEQEKDIFKTQLTMMRPNTRLN